MSILRVGLGTGNIGCGQTPDRYRRMGGRGLTALIMSEEVPAGCDPLGPENKLVITPGILSGTKFPNSGRVSLGGKSPLTGTIKESNAGGTVADSLGRLGLTALVLEGQAPPGELYLLHIGREGEARLIPAPEYQGLGSYATVKKIIKTLGPENSVLCIGPAGEERMEIASVQSSDTEGRPCRAAARGGLGAVMGSKGVKAVVVDQGGDEPEAIADPEGFRQGARSFAKALTEHPFSGKALPALGTLGLMAPVNALGAFPCYNATKGEMEGWEAISGEAMASLIKTRGGRTAHSGCSRCIIRCSNDFVDQSGEFVTASLEYETVWALGGMTGITDLEPLARMDHICDDLGVDTMSAGVAISVAMDAGHCSFGDGEAALRLLGEIARGTALGRVLGRGPSAVGEHFGHHRVPVVKNQSIAGYDPRAMQGNAVTYATSPMGADHTAGNLIGAYTSGLLNPLQTEGQVQASKNAQIMVAALDTTGLCLFCLAALNTPPGQEAFCAAMTAKWGREFTLADFLAMGRRVLNTEHGFNKRAGIAPQDSCLPRFFYEEPLPPHNQVVMISGEEMAEAMKI